jgi:hypothetical protein
VYNNYDTDSRKDDDAVSFESLMEYVDLKTIVEEWAAPSTFGATLSFSEHGLDITVAFDNQTRTDADDRVPGRVHKPVEFGYLHVLLGTFVLFVLLGFITLILVKFHSGKKFVSVDLDQSPIPPRQKGN